MDILFLALLGLVQGLTEFLPVSSSGHLVLLSNLFGISDSLFLSILLHVATLLSILVVLRKEVWGVVRRPFSKQGVSIMIATIPTCIIVLILMPLIESSFSGAALPVCFLISACLLFFAQSKSKRSSSHDLGFKDAFLIGVFQGFATFPGISRSGATISGGLLSGADREQVAVFSFLISIPIILLSMCLEVYKIIVGGAAVQINILGSVLAFVIAFAVGIVAIKVMLKLTKKASLKGFAIYLLLVCLLSIFV